MRHVTAILSVAVVVLMAADLVAQGKPSFAGEWKMVADQGSPGADLTIAQTAAAMTLEYKADGQSPAPGKFTYKLDGSASKNVVSGRGGASTEQVSKAVWAGNDLVVTTTTGAGEEKRTLSMDADHLIVEISAPARPGGGLKSTKVAYKRYERGYGG